MIGRALWQGARARRRALEAAFAIAFFAATPAAPRQDAAPSPAARASALSAADDRVPRDLSRRAFAFFWEQTDPATGIVRDRSRTDGAASSDNHVKVGSIASVGFGLTGMCIAAERGWQPREAILERTRTTLRTFAEKLEHKNGWFHHWLNVHTGAREWQSEVSSIDTALLLGGVLSVRQCFAADAGIARLAQRSTTASTSTGCATASDAAFARLATRERDDRAPLGRLQRGVDALPARDRLADASAPGGVVARLGPPDAHLGGHDLRHPRRARSSCTSTRTRGSTSAPGAIRIRRTTGSPTASPRPRANRSYCLSLRDRFPGYDETLWGITASDARERLQGVGRPPPDPQVDGTVVPCAAAGLADVRARS
jgi:hypothetical protein